MPDGCVRGCPRRAFPTKTPDRFAAGSSVCPGLGYTHVTGTLLRKVAQQVGDALWEPPKTN